MLVPHSTRPSLLRVFVLLLFSAVVCLVPPHPAWAQRPTCTVTYVDTEPSNAQAGTPGRVKFLIEFSAPVVGFDADDIEISPDDVFTVHFPSGRSAIRTTHASCPFNAITVEPAVPTIPPDKYTVYVYPYRDFPGPGDSNKCGIRVMDEAAVDENANLSEQSNWAYGPFDESPRLLITRVASPAAWMADGPISVNSPTVYFAYEFSEPVSGFGYGDVVLQPPTETGAAGGTKIAVVTGSGEPGSEGSVYIVGVSGMTYSGAVRICSPPPNPPECNPACDPGIVNPYNWAHQIASINSVNYDGIPPSSLVVTRPAGLPGPPSYAGTYNTSLNKIDIAGTAADDVAIAAVAADGTPAVTWSNDRGGSGACTGTTSWSKNGIYLKPGRNRITITAHDAAGNTISYLLTVNCSSTYSPDTIDNSEAQHTGQYSSIAVDSSGRPRIAYYMAVDALHGVLRYAAWDGQAWSIENVDGNSPGSPADDVGRDASLKLEADGTPHVSYYDVTNGDLMYAVRRNGAWQTSTVDGYAGATDNVGQYTSLALVNGLPRIAYYDVTNKKLIYASHDGLSWTMTEPTAIDNGADVGKYASLALDPATGNPRIAYYDGAAANQDLKYATYDLGVWSATVAASVGNVGQYCSLALDPSSGRPRISYHDATGQDLAYTAWDGSAWVTSPVDTAGDVGKYTSLALYNGLPRIAYYDGDATRRDLKYAVGSVAVSPVWSVSALDDSKAEATADTYDVGQYASLALDSGGNAHISYHDATNTALKYIFSSSGPTCKVDADNPTPTNASLLTFTITFSQPVTGLLASEPTVVGGTAGTLTQVGPMDGATYRLTVTPVGDATVGVRVPAGVAKAGSLDNLASNTAAVVVDRTPPSVTVDQEYIQTDPSNGSTVYFTAVFSEPVTGFAYDDVTVAGGGSKSVQVTGKGTHYNIAVTGMNEASALVATVAAGRAFDVVGNGNTASTSTDNTVWWDNIDPTCTINQAQGQYGGPTQNDPTNSPTINFTAVFAEPVIGFSDASDVTVGGSASFVNAQGQSTLQVQITPIGSPDAFGHYRTYNVAVSGMQNRGTVTCTIDAGAATDVVPAASPLDVGINPNAASTSTDNIVTYDATPVTCTINQKSDQPDPTSTQPIRYVVEFSKDVTGFTSSDVVLSGTADRSAARVVVTGSGKSYLVEVSGVAVPAGQTAGVTVIANVPANAAQDGAGNFNLAATFDDNTVAFDDKGLTVAIEQAAGQTDSTPNSPIHFTATFSEPAAGFEAADVTLGGTSTDPHILSPVAIQSGGAFDPAAVNANIGDTVTWRNDRSTVFTLDILDTAGNFIGSLELYPGETKSFADFPMAGTYTYQQRGNPAFSGVLTVNSVLTAAVAQISPFNYTVYDISVSGMAVPGSVTASLRRLKHIPDQCATPNVAIPDGNPNGVVSAIDMSQIDGRIVDLNVRLNISHSRDQDLTAYLIGPDGARVQLFRHVGATGSGFVNTVLDDEASSSITGGTAPFTGWYRPGELLSAFDGKNVKGTWTLQVSDDASGTAGTFQSWCLDVTTYERLATDALGNGNEPSTSLDNSVVYFPEQCATTPVSIPDNNTAGATSSLDLSGFSGIIKDVNVKLNITHPSDRDLTAYLTGPDGKTVELFKHAGGNAANFVNTVLDDEAGSPITGGIAPFTGSYRPNKQLSDFDNKNIKGVWQLKVVDDAGGMSGTIENWCLRATIQDTDPPVGAIVPTGGTCTPPVSFDITFTEPVLGLTENSFVIANGSVIGLTGSGASYTLSVDAQPGSQVDVTLPVGGAHDTCGNHNTVAAAASYKLDPPQVTIDKAASQPDPTKDAPVNFTVVFNKPVTGFATGDVVVTGTAFGAGAVPIATVSGSGANYNVAVSGMNQPGTVMASVPADVAQATGCSNVASTSTDNVVDFDNTPVAVTVDVAPGQLDPTIAQPINFAVSFSKPVADFAAGDVTITGTATGTKTVTILGSGTDYTIQVSGLSGAGTVIASIPAGVVHDALGNPNTASTSADNSVWFDDNKAPEVTVTPAAGQANPAKDAPVNFTVAFNKVVSGFGDAQDDVIVGGAAFSAGAVKTVVYTEGADSWNVAVSGMDQSGTVVLSVPAGVAVDGGGRPNNASNVATVDYDNVRPSVTIEQAAGQADPTAVAVANFTVEFSEPVTGFTDQDVVVSDAAFGPGSTKTIVVTGGPAVYNVEVSGMNTTGAVVATIGENAAIDAAGNGNTESTSTDNSVLYDTPPTVTINQAASQADPTGSVPISFTATFSEVVTGFGPGDVVVSGTAFGAGSTPVVVVTGAGPVFTAQVSGMNQTGTVIATVPAGAAVDSLGTGNPVSTSTDNQVSYDISRPIVTINQAASQADPTGNLPVTFTVVFSKPVADFTGADVTIAGTAGGTKTASVTGSGTTYTVTVDGATSTGTIVASIGESVAHDSVGNGNLPSGSTDNTVTHDITGPTVTVDKAAGQADPTNGSPVAFAVVFSEPVADFTAADVTIGGTAFGAGATKSAVVTGGPTSYNVAVSGMTSDGTVTASLAAGVAHDSVGNPNAASTSADNSVAFDNTGLTVTIDQASTQLDPTNGAPINFTVVFNKPVTDFTKDDVTITGTAGGTKTVTVTGSGTTYTAAVTGMNATGTVLAAVPAGAAHDEAGNANAASTSTDRTVTYDVTAPTITITKPTSDPTCVWNTDKLKIGGTADDGVALATVTWQAGKGGSGLCTGTTTWSASGIDIGTGDMITVTIMDAAGNTATDTIDVSVTPALPADGDWVKLAMVSLPVIPYDQDPKIEVGFYSDYWVSYKPDTGAYLRYPVSQTWFTPPANTPGRGFWAGFMSAAATPYGMAPDQSQPKTIHLLEGWNLIGQPFIKPVVWSLSGITVKSGSLTKTLSEAKNLGWVKDYAWGWEPDPNSTAGGAYYLVCDPAVISGATGELAPWRAYWFKANIECDLVLPAP